jgi:hypothetical protein
MTWRLNLLNSCLLFPALMLCAALVGGCAHNHKLEGENLVLLVPGAAGDDGRYGGLKESVAANQHASTVRTFHWGMPLPLFVMNLQDQGIHRKAEESLAGALVDWRKRNPTGQITLIGHSAGCGVILGSLRRAEMQLDVKDVILIAPSVSPGYDLAGALRHVKGHLHNFHSDGDALWLGWRCSNFGGYDSVRTAAAGKIGFQLANLNGVLREKVIQHPWQSQHKALGNDGGHWGALSRDFASRMIAPLLHDDRPLLADQVFSPAAQK